MKKILVLGASGAMGKYLIPLLSDAGWSVDAVAFDPLPQEYPNVRFIQGNAKDWGFLMDLMQTRYDAVIDFLVYNTGETVLYVPFLQSRTEHYIYLSSYRIYDNKEVPIRETSPRLLDTADNILLKNSDDYCIYKARGENILSAMPRKNWTILRPAITYSLMRYQLVTLEADHTVGRARAGKKVVLPEQARNVRATMSWGGDVAKMIASLVCNEAAMGETFTVSTSEHHTWGEIADYYKNICNLEAVWVDKEDYIGILSPPQYPNARWQLEYDRLFDRVIDNSKILNVTGMKQADLMPLYDGLQYEIGRCPADCKWHVLTVMDDYLKANNL